MKSNHRSALHRGWLTYFGAALAFLVLFAAANACSTNDPNVGGSTLGNTGGTAASTGGTGNSGANAGGASVSGGKSSTGGSITVPTAGNGTMCLTPASCKPTGGQWCGEIGNNCGGKVTCPNCEGDWICKDNACIGPPSCQRVTCENAGGRYCGVLGDGCGGTLDCGACPDGGTCGGGGIEHLCKPANCTPRMCTDATSGGQYCGDIGDGCGGILHCGDCMGGKACGSDGTPNVCPGAGCKNFQCTIR